MTHARMPLVFGAAGVIAIMAGVITAFVIVRRNHDDTSNALLATMSSMATKAAGSRATETATNAEQIGTPIPLDSLGPVTLMFCEPLRDPGGDGTRIAVMEPDSEAEVAYAPGGCHPDVDASGAVAVRIKDGSIVRVTPNYADPRRPSFRNDTIIWTPAKGTLNGTEVVMTGRYLRRDAMVEFNSLDAPLLTFNMTDDGKQVFGSLSERLVGYPLSTFIDGRPLRGEQGQILAPTIASRIEDSGQTTGLSLDDAKRTAALINNGLAQ